jgi:predicted DNA-binding transcriptional regulator AlpA
MTTTTTPATNATPDQTLLRLPQVLQRVPVSRSHWWAGIASGKFPAGIKLSERVTCWKSSDIQNLIASLK